VIRVDRAGGPTPNEAWFALAREKTQTAIDERAPHAVDDGIYGHVQVRMALEGLFRAKCAYCESSATTTSAWDVEHFRPKKRVKENPVHQGYYWLAYDWTNLYLACQLCNQRRLDQPTLEEPTTGPAQGKLDQFPLVDEATRALEPGDDLAAEARLLLDPCADDPARHLICGLKGNLTPIGGSPMGDATIRICNLNRKRLRRDRQAKVAVVCEMIGRLRRDMALATVLATVRDTLGAPNQPYSAVVHAICDQPAAFALV
jgi:uncharacterized protein (TIGR02646 family)